MRNGQWWKGHFRRLCGTTDIDSNRLHKSGYQLDHSGMRCGQLDYIEETDNRGTRREVPLSKWNEATQYDNPLTRNDLATESVTASVKPAICK